MSWMHDAASDRNTCKKSHRSDGVMLSSLFAGIASGSAAGEESKEKNSCQAKRGVGCSCCCWIGECAEGSSRRRKEGSSGGKAVLQ